MRKHDSFCQIHRVWHLDDCPPCVAESKARATVIYLDGEPHKPADVIRRARRVSGLTRNRLARAVGVAPSPIYNWECENTMPKVNLFLRTMAACGYRVTVEKIK